MEILLEQFLMVQIIVKISTTIIMGMKKVELEEELKDTRKFSG